MKRILLPALAVGLLLGVPAAAQDLPAPPKPPKSKAKAAEAAPENQKSPSDSAPSAATPSADGSDRGGRLLNGEIPRPRRLRINAPFFYMDLDFGSRRVEREAVPYREAPPARTVPEGEAVPAPRGEAAPAPAAKRDDQTWRYRWHDGRWWYWLPSERWVYWDGRGWIDYDRPAGRRLGAIIRNGAGGLNLGDLMQSDEIRIGEPRRGNVQLELEGLPSVNFGF